MDAKWAIYRRNLSQNSSWKMILLLKNNFGCWIKIWAKSDHWIVILPLESHPNRWIKPRFNLGRWIDDRCRQTWRAASGPSNQHGRDLGYQITLEIGVEISPKKW